MNKLSINILLLLFICLSSCQKLKYDEVGNIEEKTLACDNWSKREFIINDLNAYYSILDTTDCHHLDIDFNQKTLLGKYTEAGGCSVDYERELLVNHEDKTYLYVIKVRDRGLCKMEVSSMNWIIVPKIPKEYSIKFQIK